ncbi:MAG TPA: hypothetical protein VNG12_11730, partial [Acidimicrobiales bacterium]|nr:hypothetical protein [Acidimicrobiales bacterium]
MAAQVTTDSKFAATVVRGLVDHGPFGPSGTDLSLELALSVWLRWHTKNLLEARSALIVMRTELLRMGH